MGLGALIAGAEALVRGASRLAAAAGISPLVIWLTVFAFGTSTPELAVGVRAGWVGQADVALGNVVGSNICNALLILGAAAVVAPMVVAARLLDMNPHSPRGSRWDPNRTTARPRSPLGPWWTWTSQT